MRACMVGGEDAVVIAHDNGGLRATVVNTADGAVEGADTSTKSSGQVRCEIVQRSLVSIWARVSCHASVVR